MAYNPLLPTGLDQALIPYEVRAEYFREVLTTTNLSRWMGKTPLNIIQIDNKEMGSGSTLAIPFSPEIDYKNPIKGNFAQVSGKGQTLKFYEDTVSVTFQSFADKLPGLQFMQLDTPVKIYDALKPKLVTAHTRNIVFDLLRSATIGAYPNFTNSGPTINRVIYGSQPYPGDGFIQTGINSMTAGSAYNQDGLSVEKIRKLRDYAIQGGATYEAEKRISPTSLTTHEGAWVATYVYLMDTISYRSLANDPAWAGYFTRGTIESTNQPSGLSGAYYKGMIDNVMIYECPELANFQQNATGDATRVSWNMLIGAQAWFLLWGKEPWFDMEYSNMRNNVEMAMMEIRGQKALMFPSFSNPNVLVENGIIHHFVEITGL